SVHLPWRGPAPPHIAAAHEIRRGRGRVERIESLQGAPVPRPVVIEVGGDGDRLDGLGGPQQRATSGGALPPVGGGGGFAVGEDPVPGRLGHAAVVNEGALAGEGEADDPVDEDGVGPADDLVERAQAGVPWRGHGGPGIRGQVGVAGDHADHLRLLRDGLERDPEVAPGRGGADIDGGHGAHDLEVGGAGGPHASRTAVLDPQVVRADASGGGHHQQWAVGAAGGELIPGGGEVRGDLGPAAVGAEYRGGVGVEVERQGDGGAVDGDL